MSDATKTAAFRGAGPQGHRGRMRDRVLGAGAASLADYEVLEMLLFFGIPRRDTKPLAKTLINHFGSLSAVLHAPGDALVEAGVPEGAIRPLRLPVFGARRLAGPEARERLHLGNWDLLLAYFDAQRPVLVPGQLRVLFLDNRNRLIADEVVEAQGQHDQTKAIFARALALHATALIGVRVAVPGVTQDQQATADAPLARALASGGAALATTLHDMMVVGEGAWLSLRQRGMI